MRLAARDLTRGPVPGTLARMAGGMMIGLLAMAGFNITDTYFVSRLGTRPLAAMSFTLPVTHVIGSLALGIGTGAAAVISNLIGEGRRREVRQLTTDALLLACSSAIAHDLVANVWGKQLGNETISRINILVVWLVGLIAMVLAYNPPQLITAYYTDAIGALSAGLFVPVVAGLWWRRANLAGGLTAFSVGVAVYVGMLLLPGAPGGQKARSRVRPAQRRAARNGRNVQRLRRLRDGLPDRDPDARRR